MWSRGRGEPFGGPPPPASFLIEDVLASSKIWQRAITNSGGLLTVHPVPAPCSTKEEPNSKNKAGGSSQKLILFNLGKAISGAPIIKGTNQFPNPPIIVGITKKNIITNACAVTITLYKWSSPNIDPGEDNSNLINILKAVPIAPDKAPKTKYNDPISLWLQLKNHLTNEVIFLFRGAPAPLAPRPPDPSDPPFGGHRVPPPFGP